MIPGSLESDRYSEYGGTVQGVKRQDCEHVHVMVDCQKLYGLNADGIGSILCSEIHV